MPSFLTDDELKLAYLDVCRKYGQTPSKSLDPSFGTLVTNANEDAWEELQTILASRGYSPAQIQAWPQGPSYQRRLGIFFLLVGGATMEGPNIGWQPAKEWDYRDRLKTVVLCDAAGVTIVPMGPAGQPATIPVNLGGTFFGKFSQGTDSRLNDTETRF